MGDAFGYDRAGRLTQSGLNQASPADGLSLAGEHFNTALDPAENWTYVDKQFGGQTSAVPVSLNSRNQYTSFGAPQTFDPQGNLTSDPNGTYTFDFKNRLIEADMGSGTKLFYVYDPENRLVKKTTQIGTDSKVEETLWEGWEPAAKYVNGTLTEEDVSLGSPDSVLAFRAHNEDGSTSLFSLHSDLRGDTAGLTDQTGALLEKYRYTPYGEFLITDGSDTPLSTSRTNRLFQGLTFDADLGWYYARNRWLDPATGAFTSTDPLGYPDSANGYVWGAGNALAHDPTGLIDGDDEQELRDAGVAEQVERQRRVLHAVGNVGRAGEKILRTAAEVAPVTGQAAAGVRIYRDVKQKNYWAATFEVALQAAPFVINRAAMYARGAIQRGLRVFSRATNEERATSSLASAAVAGENGNLEADLYQNAAETRIESAHSPSLLARSRQGVGSYTGVDRWRDIILRKGKIVFAGEPGVTGFFTTARDAALANRDASVLFEGLQVSPRAGLYRPGVTAYEVLEDSPAAFGLARANPQFGRGGFGQLYVPNYERVLKPIRTDLLTNRVASPWAATGTGP